MRASAAHACGRRAGGGGPGGPRGPGGPGGADCVPARALAASSDAAGCRNHSDRVRMRARCRSCTYAPHHHVTSRDLVALTTRPRTPRFSLPLTHCATISSRQPERYCNVSLLGHPLSQTSFAHPLFTTVSKVPVENVNKWSESTFVVPRN